MRYTKHIEDTARADALAKDLCDNDDDDFWKVVKKLNQCNNIQASCIGGKSGETEIAIYWKDCFCKLLNSNTINEALKSSILDKLDGIQYTDSMSVSTVEVSDTIFLRVYLKKGKACGYMPQSLIETTSVPIINCYV